jgi:hypothetical protein
VLGGGKRLFGGGATPAAFDLISARTSPSGVVVSRYRRAGPVATGSFQLEPPTAAEQERRSKLS